ncbi:MAG: HAMP domain-containing sensor histidine kinase [Aquabacterium sp.]
MTNAAEAVAKPAAAEHPDHRDGGGRDAFVAAISHELRTPLNAILGFGRLARADLPQQADSRYLMLIEQSARLMLRVVNDLLDLTRMESGKLQVWPDQPLMPHALVARVAIVALGLRQDKAIRLYATVDPRCPVHLRGDVGRLEQILLNLVANAMKFTDRGRIVIDVRWRRQSEAGVELRFSVSDTGAGIPMEQIASLGQPFAQASDLSLPKLEGTGLGLMVVHRLLGLHGTQLKVASVAGGGSMFWFDLVLPLDGQARATEPVADTCVWSEDARLTQSVATQWCAQGHALVPEAEAARAALWLIDVAHPQAQALGLRAREDGRAAWMVSADPVAPETGAGVVELPLAASRILRTTETEARLEADPRPAGLEGAGGRGQRPEPACDA